jgi:hypothetical protein
VCLVHERYGSKCYGASETTQQNNSRKNRLFEFFLSRPRTFLAVSPHKAKPALPGQTLRLIRPLLL